MKYLKLYESYSKRSVEDFIKENNIKNDVTHLYCSNNKIESLKGIENLTNLTYLDCSNNKIESLKGIENLTKLTYLDCWKNPIKYPIELPNNLNINKVYGSKLINKFKTYELQKEFLEKYPESINVLKQFGIHEKIKEEFPDLVEGSEFGFFNLR